MYCIYSTIIVPEIFIILPIDGRFSLLFKNLQTSVGGGGLGLDCLEGD